MEYLKKGADHERYIQSGIVQLSQIKRHPHPDPFYHLSPQCRRDRGYLEQQFRHEACKPWLKEYHLEAEIPVSTWDSRTITGWKRFEETSFPCLEFTEGTTICITGGIALLETARESRAWGLTQTFGLLEPQQRWWIVDFFRDDGSHSKHVSLHSQYGAVCGILGAKVGQAGAVKPSYMRSLTPDVNHAADLVSRTAGVADAFAPLGRLPSMWTTKSFNYLNDIRKSWCIEEAINYVQDIVSQWEEITLQWHPTVVGSVDPDSIQMLQSRAPRLSKSDHDYVVGAFEQGGMLPQLTDSALREAVKLAVCRQGPILTLKTFTKDVRLLLSRVHRALATVLGDMSRRRGDTLRKRVHRILEQEFDDLYHSDELCISATVQKEGLVERCYQHVFLHTIRTELPEGSISTKQLRRLVKREFDCLYTNSENHSVSNPPEDEDDIAIVAPTVISPTYPSFEDIDAERRHGIFIFKSEKVAGLLYRDQIHKHELPISESFMAKYIVRVFLSGSRTNFEAIPSPITPIASIVATRGMVQSLPFLNKDYISCGTADGHESISGLASLATNESELDVASVLWRRPHILTADVSSEAASMVGWGTSSLDRTDSPECVGKRPLFVSAVDATQDGHLGYPSTPSKRPRSLKLSDHLARSIHPVEDALPKCTSQIPRQDFFNTLSASSTRSARLSRVDRWRGNLDVGWSEVDQNSPDTIDMNGSSIYSPSRRSLASQVMSSDRGCSSNSMKAYTELLRHHNPFASDTTTAVHELELNQNGSSAEYMQDISQPQKDSLPHNQIGRLVADSNQLGARPISKVTTISGLTKNPVSRPRHIVYKSSVRDDIVYRAPADAGSTERFVESQKIIDPLSTFWYKLKNQDNKCATSHDQLYHAICKYGLETVFVKSKQLGSTDHSSAAIFTRSLSSAPRLL
ncbi:hypothetical protein GQ44DRAFT_776643 [Phaeosphaeriaceae sp. PMI808]|nr:hypothetical protein GQ44DRAFT_776643 [Phaeosphaeriaceae sp. PMI808]